MFRRTKIVATVGPACAPEKMLGALIDAGVNVFRLNFSHGDMDDHKLLAERIRQCALRQDRVVALLADLQGPKIRIARFRDGAVTLREGDDFTLDSHLSKNAGDATQVGVDYPTLSQECAPGDTLLLDDGLIELTVVGINGHRIHCRVIAGGRLSDNKGINRKGGGLNAQSLTDKDHRDIRLAVTLQADYLALSFPRHADDVDEARRLYRQAGGKGGIVAKIERAEAVADPATLDGIIAAADGVMVARGDLAVEIGDAALIGVQKHIIRRARELDRFVITATQMMESMIHSPQPTRAEVSDVANAVLDGTDAVMLSAETATGEHPLATVQAMDRILRGAERTYQLRPVEPRSEPIERAETAIARAAMYLANHLQEVKAIVALTESGNTTLLMSRVRSGLPILALTPHPETLRRVALYRGVQPVAFDPADEPPERLHLAALAQLRTLGLLQAGDRIIITRGDTLKIKGGTNTLKIVTVGKTQAP